MEAMIFSAGLGTRLQEYTKNKPKALVEVEGRSLLEININRLISFGFRHIVINIHHFKDQILDFIHSHAFDAEIFISDERDELLDTGGGLLKALHLFSGKNPILLHNVDVLSNINLTDLYSVHIKQSASATLAVSERETSRYLLFCNNRMFGWKNLKTGQAISFDSCNGDYRELAFSGIHVINPQLIDYMNIKGKFSMTDLYIQACRKFIINAYVHSAKDWLDIGTPETLQKAVNFLKTL